MWNGSLHGMGYSRELKQIQKAIVRAGDGAVAVLKTPPSRYPSEGKPAGTSSVLEANFVAVNYTREDISDDSLANGLLKILITPLSSSGDSLVDFVEIIETKGTQVTLPDGKEFGIRHSQISRPDGVTPILARIFLGA